MCKKSKKMVGGVLLCIGFLIVAGAVGGIDGDTVGVIHDYQTASPELIIKDKSCFGSEEDGVGTIYIPIKFCPECGRKLGR